MLFEIGQFHPLVGNFLRQFQPALGAALWFFFFLGQSLSRGIELLFRRGKLLFPIGQRTFRGQQSRGFRRQRGFAAAQLQCVGGGEALFFQLGNFRGIGGRRFQIVDGSVVQLDQLGAIGFVIVRHRLTAFQPRGKRFDICAVVGRLRARRCALPRWFWLPACLRSSLIRLPVEPQQQDWRRPWAQWHPSAPSPLCGCSTRPPIRLFLAASAGHAARGD